MPPLTPPMGQVDLDNSFATLDFSSWLGLLIESQFRALPEWDQADPIAIGSWGRGELCPGSDFDVVFCGDEKAVSKVVESIQDQGFKLRYRVPEDLEDWTRGVDVLESNALFSGKPFTHRAAVLLLEQKNKILKRKKSYRKELLKQITTERKERFKRYDSIANFLEPNLKYGHGGLRDLQQALILTYWFPEKFKDIHHAFKVLYYYKSFFLIIRQKLHLQMGGDILVSHEQMDLAKWLGYETNLDFMREVQKGLSRVSFHSDWVFERCRTSDEKLSKLSNIKINSWKEAFQLIRVEPNLLAQYRVRRALYESRGFKKKKEKRESLGKNLRKSFHIKESEELMIALFRSHIVSHALPDFLKIIGLVQHDQYHRYSVDAHLLQAMREVKRVYNQPSLLGRLGEYCKKMSLKDWEILTFAALYHDMAKGRGGAHERKGQQLVKKDFASLGFPKEMMTEVAWLVENHLVLSQAAFRKNPRSPKTWQNLFDRGLQGQRLFRLALFTAMDIRATNPEAWSTWKENLLWELTETLRAPSSKKYISLVQSLRKEKVKIDPSFIEKLDLAVAENISHKILVQDFKALSKGGELGPLVFQDRKKQTWVRFHQRKDEKGLFLKYAQSLSVLGCNVRQAAILTDSRYGVYDWFRVKSRQKPKKLEQMLCQEIPIKPFGLCGFSRIQLVDQDEEEWVYSFQAKDRKGLLVSAIQALYDQGLEIEWAKVHTWGRQIDDVFGVRPLTDKGPVSVLKSLEESLLENPVQTL